MNLDNLISNKYSHGTFHDAVIESINLDYMTNTAKLKCNICIGDPDSQEEKQRELRASGHLIITGLLYCVVEPPDPKYPYQQSGGLWVSDDGTLVPGKIPMKTKKPTPLPRGAFEHYFFINDWNSFIYIAAMNATFEWD